MSKFLWIITALVVIAVFFLLSSDDPARVELDTETPTEISSDNESLQIEPTKSGSVMDGEVSEVLESETSDNVDEVVEDVASKKVFTLNSFKFGYSETEIRVRQGDTVTINITNSDGYHDWVVDEFAAATSKINEGETTSVTFVADQTGTFEYYCSVGDHRALGMMGTLVVE